MYEEPLRELDRRLLGVLADRDGSASPGELGEAAGVPARTLTRALGRLDTAGLLAERSKACVRLSAFAWQLLYAPLRPGEQRTVIDDQENRDVLAERTVYRARTSAPRAGGLAVAEEEQPALDDPEHREEHAEPLDEEPVAHEQDEPEEGGGFWRGFVES